MRDQVSFKASTMTHSRYVIVVCFFHQSEVQEHSHYMKTVSLGSMPYSCLFDSDSVVLRPRLELLVGDWWRHILDMNSISGQVVWLVLVFIKGKNKEVCHLSAADTPTLSEITPPVKSCHIHWDKTVAWLLLLESFQLLLTKVHFSKDRYQFLQTMRKQFTNKELHFFRPSNFLASVAFNKHF